MGEKIVFGIDTRESIQRRSVARPESMFPDGDDLPLFSGTPVVATEKPFEPEDHSMKQAMLPDMPGIDYERVLQKDKARYRRTASVAPESGMFTADNEKTLR
jgi:hypothetical protein